MLITQRMTVPTSLTVAIWSLRSVPISLLALMFVFNSGSIRYPYPNVQFWFDTIAVLGIIAILGYWHRFKGLRWNAGLVAYLYICLTLLLRDPYGILSFSLEGQVYNINYHSFVHSAGVALGIIAIGLLLELLIYHLRRFHVFAWWIALIISMLCVASIFFFFSGTLGIWSLLDPDTKRVFKRSRN